MVYTLFTYQNPCPQVECNDQRHIGEVNEFVAIETQIQVCRSRYITRSNMHFSYTTKEKQKLSDFPRTNHR